MKFYFAPFHGIETQIFRSVFLHHFGGFDAIITPFIPAVERARLSKSHFKDIFPKEDDFEIIPQIIGNKTEDILATVDYLYHIGFKRINLNLGCPMPKIIRKNRACGLMPLPDKIEDIVAAVTALPVKFSLKMRLGLFDKNESLVILSRLADYPLDFVAIHARLGIQQYEGQVDKIAFDECWKISKHTLIYNGDIFSIEDFLAIKTQFIDLEYCMLGRGMFRNPFLLAQIKGKIFSKDEKKQKFALFYDDLITAYTSFYCEKIMLNRLKELWKYFAVFFELTIEELNQLLRIESLKQFLLKTHTIIEKY